MVPQLEKSKQCKKKIRISIKNEHKDAKKKQERKSIFSFLQPSNRALWYRFMHMPKWQSIAWDVVVNSFEKEAFLCCKVVCYTNLKTSLREMIKQITLMNLFNVFKTEFSFQFLTTDPFLCGTIQL